uniref:Uncharacterized protein n=1 Tax=Kalanchoe fedtschenkoi TaxID=63787 RepID=A0A7N0UKK0_KALFE
MSYLSRVWMAASVAVVEGQQGAQGVGRGGPGLNPLRSKKKGSSSGGGRGAAVADGLRNESESERVGSLQSVMYLNCWIQS